MFRELGAQVLDADAVAREVVEPGTPGLAEVAARFPGVVGAGRAGWTGRSWARASSRDPAERAALNAIVHPLDPRGRSCDEAPGAGGAGRGARPL